MATDRDLDRDVQADVELAEKGPDFERRLGEPIPGVRNRPAGPPELADDDLLIERKDLGDESGPSWPRATRSRPGCASFPDVQLGRRHASGRR